MVLAQHITALVIPACPRLPLTIASAAAKQRHGGYHLVAYMVYLLSYGFSWADA